MALDQQGDLQGAQGDLAGAFKSYRDSLEIREKLAGQDPNNTGWQRDLSIVYERSRRCAVRASDLAGALKSYRAEVALQEPPGEARP